MVENNKPEIIVAKIIENLSDRKGFSYWWHTVDEDTKQEILHDLARDVELELKKGDL